MDALLDLDSSDCSSVSSQDWGISPTSSGSDSPPSQHPSPQSPRPFFLFLTNMEGDEIESTQTQPIQQIVLDSQEFGSGSQLASALGSYNPDADSQPLGWTPFNITNPGSPVVRISLVVLVSG